VFQRKCQFVFVGITQQIVMTATLTGRFLSAPLMDAGLKVKENADLRPQTGSLKPQAMYRLNSQQRAGSMVCDAAPQAAARDRTEQKFIRKRVSV
jgi:hypothetical protein